MVNNNAVKWIGECPICEATPCDDASHASILEARHSKDAQQRPLLSAQPSYALFADIHRAATCNHAAMHAVRTILIVYTGNLTLTALWPVGHDGLRTTGT